MLEAKDGEDALEVAAGHALDLLITDIVMPKINGSDLARRLRAQNPALRIVYISGYVGNVLDNQELLDAGTAFVQKPFSGRELTHTVRRLLDRPFP